MTTYQLRGHGQIWSATSPTLDGTDWQNVLSMTTTADAAGTGTGATRYGYGKQLRYAAALAQTGTQAVIPDSPATHPEITIPKGTPIILHAGLGYTISSDGKVISQALDPMHFARVRLVTGRSAAAVTPITGWDELICDNTLTAYFSMPQATVPSLGLPAKANVPIVSDIPNGDGSYLVSYSRRFFVRVPEDIVVPANAGFSVQMKSTTLNRGFEYDVQVPVTA